MGLYYWKHRTHDHERLPAGAKAPYDGRTAHAPEGSHRIAFTTVVMRVLDALEDTETPLTRVVSVLDRMGLMPVNNRWNSISCSIQRRSITWC